MARYTEDRSPNFDIHLPEWLARHNKTIYTVIIVIAAITLAVANA